MRLTPIACALLALPLAAQESQSYSLAGDVVALYNIAGSVTVQGGGRGPVTVAGSRTGPDAARLTVETGTLRDRMTLRVLYPEDRIIYPGMGRGSNSTFSIREDGTWGDEEGRRNRQGDRRRITVRGDGDGLEAAANLRVTIPEGRRVFIYLGFGRIEASTVNGELYLDTMAGDVTARGTEGLLNIDTGSGEISVTDVAGRISLDTGSGDVTVTGLKEGELEVDTGSGSVNGSRITARRIGIDTGSGDIELRSASAPVVSLDTGSGSIRVDLTGAIDRLEAETGSGNVSVRLPESVNATVTLETGSGDIDLSVPLQLVRKSEGEIQGRLGDGRGIISLETGSGDIELIR